MKKLVLITVFALFAELTFAIANNGKTKDGYDIQLYQIDKKEFPKGFEFYVRLISEDTGEYFTWCFDRVSDAMEHFMWLQDIEVVETRNSLLDDGEDVMLGLQVITGQLSREEAKAIADSREPTIIKEDNRRPKWRKVAYNGDQAGEYFNYWIDPKSCIDYNFQNWKDYDYNWR